MPQNFSADAGQNLQVIHSTLYNHPNLPKSSSSKVHIPYLIRMVIKFSCAVPDIDQSVLLLSIPEMQNLARNISGFGSERSLIIISYCFKHIKKRGDGLQVTRTGSAGIRLLYLFFCRGDGYIL